MMGAIAVDESPEDALRRIAEMPAYGDLGLRFARQHGQPLRLGPALARNLAPPRRNGRPAFRAASW